MRRVLSLLVIAAVLTACGPADAVEPAASSSSPGLPVAIASPVPAPSTPEATPRIEPESPVPSATPASTAEPTPEPTAEPVPEPTAEPTPKPEPEPAARARPYAVNLATRSDFAAQYTFEWCVGASVMMARSIITGGGSESRRTQRRYWEMARERTIGSPYGGANPVGWAATLTDLDLGAYRLVSLPTFDEAVTRAAKAIVQTGRPVGLVMWAGRHAWVMTGFEATANPRRHPDARVTRIRVMDPLYPHGSRWGPSPEPNALITRKALARQFVARNRPDYDFGMEPGWLLVLPVE
jgi:hypothetical protein